MDHRLGTVYGYGYGYGAGASGLLLLVYGLLGLPDDLAYFGTTDQRVAGLPSNSLLASLDAKADFLAFRPQHVIFSFAVVLLRLTFGMYIRVRSGLPHDDPYWRALNPESAHKERTLTSATGSAPAKLSRELAGSVRRSR